MCSMRAPHRCCWGQRSLSKLPLHSATQRWVAGLNPRTESLSHAVFHSHMTHVGVVAVDVKDEALRTGEGKRAPGGISVSLSDKLSNHRSSNLRHFQLSVSQRESHPPPPKTTPSTPTAGKQKMAARAGRAGPPVTCRARQVIDPLLILSNRTGGGVGWGGGLGGNK